MFWVLCLFWLLTLYQRYTCQSLSRIRWLPPSWFDCFLCCKKFSNFLRSQFSAIGFNSWVNVVLVRKSFSTPLFCRLLPIFYSRRFSVFGFTLRYLIYLELNFVQGDKYGYDFILLHVNIQFSSTICWKCCLSSSMFFWHLC